MANLWITYAWADNEHSDVDYIAQELRNTGINVKLDRWNLGAGKPLWEQIEHFIQNPTEIYYLNIRLLSISLPLLIYSLAVVPIAALCGSDKRISDFGLVQKPRRNQFNNLHLERRQ